MTAPVEKQRFDFPFVRLIEKVRVVRFNRVLGVWNCDKKGLSCLIYNVPFFESSLEVNVRKTTD